MFASFPWKRIEICLSIPKTYSEENVIPVERIFTEKSFDLARIPFLHYEADQLWSSDKETAERYRPKTQQDDPIKLCPCKHNHVSKSAEYLSSSDAWMSGIDYAALFKREEEEEQREMLQLLDDLYPHTKRCSRKALVRKAGTDLSIISVPSNSKRCDISKLLDVLESIFKAQGCRQRIKLEQTEQHSMTSSSKFLAIIRKRDGGAKPAAQI